MCAPELVTLFDERPESLSVLCTNVQPTNAPTLYALAVSARFGRWIILGYAAPFFISVKTCCERAWSGVHIYISLTIISV